MNITSSNMAVCAACASGATSCSKARHFVYLLNCYNPSLREARESNAHVRQVCHQRVNELQDVRAVFKSVLAVVWRKVGQLVLEAQGV